MMAFVFVLFLFFPLAVLGSHINYGIVIDAGSTGSRIHIYNWTENSKAHSIPEFDYVKTFKIVPGISTYGSHPEEAGPKFQPLLDYAKEHIPAEQHSTTPLFLLATAGMRALPHQQQGPILDSIRTAFRQSPFRFKPEWARVMDGRSEAVFNWLSINYLYTKLGKDATLKGKKNNKEEEGDDEDTMGIDTLGGLDLGGRSTQIAFEISEAEFYQLPTQVRFKIAGLGAKPIHLYAWSHANFGNEISRVRLTQHLGAQSTSQPSATPHSIRFSDPCVPRGLTLNLNSSQDPLYGDTSYIVQGAGSFSNCTDLLRDSLSGHSDNNNKNETKDYCPYQPTEIQTCPFQTVYHLDVPTSMRFVAVSSFFYTGDFIRRTEKKESNSKRQKRSSSSISSSQSTLRKLLSISAEVPQDVDFDLKLSKMEELSRSYCSKSWDSITQRYSSIEGPDNLAKECFSASYVLTLLKHGYGFPSTAELTFSLKKKNEEVGWTLGAMLFAIANNYSLDPVPHFFNFSSPQVTTILAIFVIVAAALAFIGLRWWQKNRNGNKRILPYSLFNDKDFA